MLPENKKVRTQDSLFIVDYFETLEDLIEVYWSLEMTIENDENCRRLTTFFDYDDFIDENGIKFFRLRFLALNK